MDSRIGVDKIMFLEIMTKIMELFFPRKTFFPFAGDFFPKVMCIASCDAWAPEAPLCQSYSCHLAAHIQELTGSLEGRSLR